MRGYPLIIQDVDDHTNELDLAIQETNSRNLCGVILLGGTFGYSAERFRQLAIPCVLVTVSASIEFLFDMLQGNRSQHIIYDAVLTKRGSCRPLQEGKL